MSYICVQDIENVQVCVINKKTPIGFTNRIVDVVYGVKNLVVIFGKNTGVFLYAGFNRMKSLINRVTIFSGSDNIESMMQLSKRKVRYLNVNVNKDSIIGKGGTAIVCKLKSSKIFFEQNYSKPMNDLVVDVAYKMPYSERESINLVFNEVNVLSFLAHPNIISKRMVMLDCYGKEEQSYYDVIINNEREQSGFIMVDDIRIRSCPGLVMDAYKGSLRCFWNELTNSEKHSAIENILSAVAYMHDEGVVHMDLKPDNVLLDSLNNAVVTDFGLGSINNTSNTCTCNIMGTAKFASNEMMIKHFSHPEYTYLHLGDYINIFKSEYACCGKIILSMFGAPNYKSWKDAICQIESCIPAKNLEYSEKIKTCDTDRECKLCKKDFVDGCNYLIDSCMHKFYDNLPMEMKSIVMKLLKNDPNKRISAKESHKLWMEMMKNSGMTIKREMNL